MTIENNEGQSVSVSAITFLELKKTFADGFCAAMILDESGNYQMIPQNTFPNL